ncbi:acyl-CoA dehydrogenase family protein [Ornithinibacillus halotolerans]|uniref:Acyl-CoA dehydrogenase n=1 Tax=Ornithinibacillus halotolerans TaxID=1274357 RepID=A0A916RRA9_9BACI|nr:acyl-CoA dehydrogenase family protein [Ornithinibacillus halotolerans]GGA66432.1 acyl-CoA dehydrogenase [Ornithinibacillus halotolerans]
MISFHPTEEELAFLEVAKDFAKKKIRKVARTGEVNLKVNEELVEEARELGFLSLELPEEWNGLELPLISQVQIMKALSYGDLGIVQGLPSAGDAAPFYRIMHNYSQLQSVKEKYMDQPDYCSVLIDLCKTSDFATTELVVKRKGNNYELNGMTEPVRLARFAESVVLFAFDQEGQAVILLVQDNKWTVQEGDYRLGLLASGLGRLVFENCVVPANQVIVTGNDAEKIMKKVRTRKFVLEAAKQNGLMEAALDYTTQYTTERKAFGQEIAKFQGVSFKIAKMAMETRIVNHLMFEAALKADEDSQSAYGLALRALHRAHKGVRFVTDAAVQLLGGHGFIQEFPVEKWMRDAQAQVALYGRESNYLLERGTELLTSEGRVSVE